MFKWNIALVIMNPDSWYHGGYFKGKMTFPTNYPYSPPTFQFDRPLFHPNIYPDGKLCISILHAPGDDEMSGELATERWTPIQKVESVLLSIISLLDDAEVSSPANVDAGVLLRKDKDAYKKKVRNDVEKSKEDIPEDFTMPESHMPATPVIKDKEDEHELWYDSDAEDDFNGSDTDNEMVDDDEDGDQEFEEEAGDEDKAMSGAEDE